MSSLEGNIAAGIEPDNDSKKTDADQNQLEEHLQSPLIGADEGGTKVHDEKKDDATDENKFELKQGIQFTRRGNKKEQKMILASRATTMDPRHSFGVYPRFDSAFKKKRSLNFDIMQTELFVNRETQSEGWQWLAYLIIGILVGVIAYLMSLFEEWIVDERIQFVQWVLQKTNNSQAAAWGALATWCFTFAAAGSAMTIYIGPGANGSGIADLMAYINGINYTGMIGYNTLLIKIVGVVFGIAGALCIGKEGPLAHIGAIVALAVVYVVPIYQFKEFQNDTHKREFVCAGISAGVSAAFASPIGGALFSYEMSKPSTFWTFQMIWKTFFCSSVSTFTLSILNQIQEQGFHGLLINSAGTVKFGSLQDISIPAGQVYGSIVLGVLGGVLGSLFITVNTQMGYLRKKWVTNNFKRIVETGMFGAATISVMALIVIQFRKCEPIPPCKGLGAECTTEEEDKYTTQTKFFIRWDCQEGGYSPLATLFFNTEGGTIRNLFKKSQYFDIDAANLALFGLVWYFFTITTYGVKIPAGLFLPGIIMGGAMGRLWAYSIQYLLVYDDPGEIEQNTILGSAAMLSGYCRLTYSLTVIMLETTQAVNLFIPMMLTMLSSYFTAIYFNQSLYVRALRDKQCPFLTTDVPAINKNLRAQLFMKAPHILPTVPLVSEIEEALRKGYRVFPLKNLNGQLVGQIPQSFLIILLEKMQWYTGTMQPSGLSKQEELYGKAQGEKLTIIEEEQNESTLHQSNGQEKPKYQPLNVNQTARETPEASGIQSVTASQRRVGSTRSLGSDMNMLDYRISTQNVDDDPHNQIRKMNMQQSVQQMMEKKRTYLHLTADQLRAISTLEKKAMRDLCRFERRGSETDLTEIPSSDCLTTPIMDWREFNPDFYSTEREFSEVEQICAENGKERIDLRPYMIFQPYVCFTTDRIQKVLDIFRNFNLRQLCVVSPINGQLTGVISRQDLFEYLSL